MTPELSLLLLCSHPRALWSGPAPWAVAAGRVADWDLFLQLAGRHGLLPLLGELARDHDLLPGAVGDRLTEVCRGNAARSLWHSAELLRIREALDAVGVPVVALKGPVLAQAVYRDPTLRQFSDLDLLVPPEHVAPALKRLEEFGYAPQFPAQFSELGRALRRALRSRNDLMMQHPDSGIAVELHWSLARPRCGLRLSTSRVFERAVRVPLLDQEVLSPHPVDLFVYLAVHTSEHGWDRLEQLRCLAEIVLQHSEIDWSAVMREAEDLGAQRRVHIAVLLLAETLGVAWDERVLREAQADAGARRVAARVGRRWGTVRPPLRTGVRAALDRALSLDGCRAQARYALSLVVEPDEVDWHSAKLPPQLYPLYYLVRPLRLAALGARQAFAALAGKAKARPSGTGRPRKYGGS